MLPSALPAPSPSAIVRARSEQGAQEFVRYWFATLDYATQTGDISRLTAASDTGCQPCEDAISVVRNSYSDGGYLQGGTYTLRSVSPEEFAPDDRPMMTVSYDRSARSAYSPDGQVRGSDAPLSFASAQVTVEWLGGGWKVSTIVGEPLPS